MPLIERPSPPARRPAPTPAAAAPAAASAKPSPAAPAAAAAPARAVVAAPTTPTHVVSGWSPRRGQYGFSVRARFASTTGDVNDLIRQGTSVQRVTRYGRNDFASHYRPPNPSVTGSTLTTSNTSVLGTNLLEMKGDKKHGTSNRMLHPTRRAPSGPTAGATKGPGPGPKPGVLSGRQTYQSKLPGGSWRNVASSYRVERAVVRSSAGRLHVRVSLGGVHQTIAPYRP